MVTPLDSQRRRAASGDQRTLHLQVPADARFARTVRDALTGFAALNRVGAEDLEALLFAVGEALANAMEHADSGEDLEVFCEIDSDRIVATVIDHGRGFATPPPAHAAFPDDLCERGRGVPIMQRCTDFFAVLPLPEHGTAVRLGRFLRSNATATRKPA